MQEEILLAKEIHLHRKITEEVVDLEIETKKNLVLEISLNVHLKKDRKLLQKNQ